MRPTVPLPDADLVRREVQQMVDLGPRLTGYPAHDAFCSWILDELAAAGCGSSRSSPSMWRGRSSAALERRTEE